MSATLQTVAIPGYADACRKEARVRDTAFLDGLEIVCGVEVYPLSLRRLIWLEMARNGFVVPCRFDDEQEMLAHAVQLLYFCSPSFKVPKSPKVTLWGTFLNGFKQHRFMHKVLSSGSAHDIIMEVKEWQDENFMDAPTGSNEVTSASYVAYPAMLIDALASAGHSFSYDQVMDMPLRRIWQHWRVAMQRITGMALTNPSDIIAVQHLEKVKL